MRGLILFFSCIIATVGFSQTTIKFGYEVGVSMATLPKITKRASTGHDSKDRFSPIISPVLGIKSELEIKKHFYLSLGLQYQTTGIKRRYTSKTSSLDIYPQESEQYSFIENIDKKIFHKINIPLAIGYKFKGSTNIKPSVFIGYTPNFYVYGKHYIKRFRESSYVESNYNYEGTNYPLNTNLNFQAVKTFHNQVTLGFSFLIKEKIKLNLFYNRGKSFYYYKHKPVGWCSTGIYENNGFGGNDFGLSAIYFIK